MKKRTVCPKNNKYYIMKSTGGLNGAVKGKPTQAGANVLDNCVGYANGRYNEIWNDPELTGVAKAFHAQLVCNAENFIESAKKQGLKISSVPVLGGIMVWQKGRTLSDGDGAGHVAVVEQINADGSIITSESGWNSWAFKLVTRTNANGRWGQTSAYKFRGCIINPSIGDDEKAEDQPLVVDGIGGGMTVRFTQRFFNKYEDGVLSGQNRAQSKYYPALRAVEYGKGGSPTVKAMQKWLGAGADGVWGKETSMALQRFLKKEGLYSGKIDGICGAGTMKGWQTFLNKQFFPSGGGGDKKSSLPSDTVVDISDFQDPPIDWNAAKADGVKGVIVRCGYRGAEKGTLNVDKHFFEHIKAAYAAEVKVGIYMFTEGINAAEGREEADYAIQKLKEAGVPISYPIGVDTEKVNVKNERARNLTKAQRTEVIKALCERIKEHGYEPMIYASTSWLNNKLDMSKLPFMVWCAQYNSVCEYKGKYVMWQYTSEGKIAGYNGRIDMNHCYLPDDYSPVIQPPVEKKGYEGAYPNIYATAEKLVAEAKRICYPKGTDSDVYAYKGGSAKEECKEDLNKAYPNRKSWGKAARLGCSCDVLIGIILRITGLSPKYPRGLSGQYDYAAPSGCDRLVYKDANPYTKSKDNDIIIYTKDKKGETGHACFRAEGVLFQANHEKWYGHITSAEGMKEKLNVKRPKVIIYRPRPYLSKGDISDEVTKLQKYLNWFGGYGLTEDRAFGTKTLEAVKDMQTKLGVTADGMVGKDTLDAMQSYKR